MIRARSLPLAGLLALAALPAAGQQRDETFPRELVMTLLLSSGSATGPQLLAGRLPDGFPAEVAPAGARVVGSLSRRTGQSVVFALPKPRAEAAAAFVRKMEGAGWTRPPADEVPREGFIPPLPGARASDGSTGYLCLEGCRSLYFRSLYFHVFPREAGGSYLRIEVSPIREYSPCKRREAQPVTGAPREPLVPALYAPEDAELGGSGSSSSGDSRELYARLDTPLAPADLVAHYREQLREAGWTPGAASAGEGIAVQSFVRREASGTGWHGFLTAVTLPGTDKREVSFRVTPVADSGS